VKSAFTTVLEDELLFVEPPPEVLAEDPDCVWQPIYKLYGRRNAARCWQDHAAEVLTSKDCPLKMERCPKVPTVYFCASENVTLNIHVDEAMVVALQMGRLSASSSTISLVFST
jgi:hypothetical protein